MPLTPGDNLVVASTSDVENRGAGEARQAPDRQREVLLLWGLCFLAFRTLVPFAAGMAGPVWRPLFVVAFMFLSLLGPRLAAPLRLAPGRRVLFFVLFAGLSLLTAFAKPGALSGPSAALLDAYSDLFLIAAAAMLGHILAGLFREPSILAPVAIASALVDYWGVYFGTTKTVIEKHPDLVSKLSVQVPIPGMVDFPIGIGFGDFVFLAMFLVCALRFGMRERLTFWLSLAFLATAMMIVVYVGPNVPALVPMAVAFLAANVGCFRLQRAEAMAMLYAALIVGAVVAVVAAVR